MRIGLLGQFGSGNLGNDGTLEAMLAFLRQAGPELDLLCICPGPESVEHGLGLSSIGIGAPSSQSRVLPFLDRLLRGAPRRLRNLSWALKQSRNLDVMIVPGTGIFDDFCESPFGWPYVILRWCLAARINRVPIFFLSIGAGPVRHPLSRMFIATAARTATYRSFRDVRSWKFATSLRLDTAQDPVNCDLAFKLPRAPAPLRSTHGPVCVGVGVMAYYGWKNQGRQAEIIYQRYLDKMHDFVAWLLARGMNVRLLTGGSVDRRAVGDILDRLGRGTHGDWSRRVAAEKTDSLNALMREIAQTDIVVATRYHNVVCALNMGRPTISLGYAAKNDDLLARVGSAAFCHHVETFDTDTLKRQVDMMLDQRLVLGQKIRQAMAGFHEQLDEQEKVLRQALGLAVCDRCSAEFAN